MKRLALLLLWLPALVGCESLAGNPHEEAEVDRLLAESVFRAQIDQAIVTQNTLYPYHFTQYGYALNPLGLRDLQVLAERYCRNGGVLNVHQGDAPDALYARRVQAVRDALRDLGVPAGNFEIADGLPGGEGLPADDALRALQAIREEELSESGPTTGILIGAPGGVQP